MFLRKTPRKKDGKTHDYWSVVENKRVAGGRVVQRHVLYLGEINSSQAAVWRKAIEVLDETRDIREHFRCSPRIAARASRPIRQSSNFACRTCSYAGLAKSVAVAGVAFDRPCRTKRPSCQSPAAYRFSIQAVALSMPNEGGTKSPLAERVMGDPRPSEKGRSPCGDYCCLDSSISAD